MGTREVSRDHPVYARRRLWVFEGHLYQHPTGRDRAGMFPPINPRRAICRRRTRHRIPGEACVCGIDASKADRMRALGSGEAIAILAGWGKVVEHEKGWRFEVARVAGLVDDGRYSPFDDSVNLPLLAKRYRVELWPLGLSTGRG